MRPRTRLREWTARAALAAASLLATLAALEGALRLAALGQGGGRRGEREVYLVHDALLGWRKQPGARVTYRRSEYTVEVAVNSHGLRDPERGYDVPAGTQRVLALGDSYVEGYSVPLDETVTRRLAAALSRGGRHVDVVNAGTRGYSTDQEYLYYVNAGARYGPRVVLLFFYHNDVVFNDREHYYGLRKPAFDADAAGRLVLRRQAVPRPARGADPQEPPAARSGARLYLLDWLAGRLATGAPWHYNRLAALGLWEPLRPRPVRLEMRVFQREVIPELERAWGVTGAVLAQLARAVEARGSRLLVVYVPSRMEVQDDSWEATRFLYAMEPHGWERTRVAQRLLGLGRRHGFRVLDLTAPLRAADRGIWGRPYYRLDGHWTALGHAAAADALAHFLERSGWIETR